MEVDGAKELPTQKTLLHFKAKIADTKSLKTFGEMLKKTQQSAISLKYGNVFSLLEVSVQIEAITALSQYYDPPLRCFTFSNFQLAPTLEEFEQIMGLPLKDGVLPYHYLGHYPSLETLSRAFKVNINDLKNEISKSTRGETKGLSRKYLEEHMRQLARDGDWDTFADILVLTIYGIILFPSSEDIVDLAAIDVFFARKDRGENPVPAILADVYCTMDFCHLKKGKRILCCLPVLYLWLSTHIFKTSGIQKSPFMDFHLLSLEAKNGREWAEKLADLTETDIRWCLPWVRNEVLIYRCGAFSNVPLVGTRGCINYNPVLALRQLGYTIGGPPSTNVIAPFIVYYKEGEWLTILRTIRNAWSKIERRGRDLGVRGIGASESYHQWLKERVQKIKLPFRISTPLSVDKPSASLPIEDEEVKGMKARLAKVEINLKEARQAYVVLEQESTKKGNNLEDTNKRLRTEKDYVKKRFDSTNECLRAANKELGLRNQELNKLNDENQQLRSLLENAKIAQKNAVKQADDLKIHMEDLIAGYETENDNNQQKIQQLSEQVSRMEGIIVECEASSQRDRIVIQQLIKQTDRQDEAIKGWKEYYEREKLEAQHWKTRFSQLAALANAVIAGVPEHLAGVFMCPFSTPKGIRSFIEYCRDMIAQMKEMAKKGK